MFKLSDTVAGATVSQGVRVMCELCKPGQAGTAGAAVEVGNALVTQSEPPMFRAADLVLLTKMDLQDGTPHFDDLRLHPRARSKGNRSRTRRACVTTENAIDMRAS